MVKFTLILSFLMTGLNTMAFTLNTNFAAAFPGEEVSVNLATHDCSNLPYTNDEILSMATEGVNKFWNKVSTSKLKIRRGQHVSVSSDFESGALCTSNTNGCVANPALSGQSQILISCNSNSTNFSSSGVLAVTANVNTSGVDIIGSVILLNNIDYSPGESALSNLSRESFISVLAHEIGHAVGLGHSPVKDSLMYYANISNRVSLGEDDMDGITYLYPREQPTSCGSVAYIQDDYKGGKPIASLLLLIGLITLSLKTRKKALLS